MKKGILLLCYLFVGSLCDGAAAQDLAVKTNLLIDATTTLNLGVEIGLGRRTTLDISGNYNPWKFRDNKKLKHWLIQPEFRYWTCERFRGHFFGVHLLGGQYNVGGIELPFGIGENGIKTHRYQGYGLGGGLAYGYHWMLGGRWGLEATLGLGYIRLHYDEYLCPKCSPNLGTHNKNYWGITKAGITLIFMIK